MVGENIDGKAAEDTVARFANTPARSDMPIWYPELLASVSQRISLGRLRATTTVTRELNLANWEIGKLILDRQSTEGWGSKIIDRLVADLHAAFPHAKGYSPRNLKYMRKFAEEWPWEAIVQRVAQLPWGHHVVLLDKLSTVEDRSWYASHALSEGWSRIVMVHQIETRLHERAGEAVTNFASTLPPMDSDLAQQATKDPYIFDFLAMTERSTERDLESQLVRHVEKFLLELGQGFAFVGEQMRLTIGGDEFFPDLLFYNFRLRRFIVIELKATKFDPGYLGQLGMYMSAVDDLLAHKDDKPTIGLLLCKTKNSVVAEYALRGYKSPIGVAEWATALQGSLPDELTDSLPGIDELEAELGATNLEDTNAETTGDQSV